jgi:N-acetylglucosaminyl-diphospho-decaprenol L-rhamnosyltransferase
VSTAPYFSAIVVSFHTGPDLDSCLAALLAAAHCREVVLVDNGNPANIASALEAQARLEPKLKLIKGHGNIGFGRACNLAVDQAQADLLVFVNPDCVIDEMTLPVLADELARHPQGLIGGFLRNPDGREQRGCRRGPLTPWSAFVSFLNLGRPGEEAGIWRDFNRTCEPFPSQSVAMPVVSGALMAITRRAFKAIGGFDAAFFLHVEDVDLCRRVREAGGAVVFAPEATAVHFGATSAVSTWAIERAKIASFTHYFWKNAQGPVDHVALIVVLPVLAAALMVRLLLRGPKGRLV